MKEHSKHGVKRIVEAMLFVIVLAQNPVVPWGQTP